MSGTISLSAEIRWSAASWLFDWVLESLAGAVEDAELAGELRSIVDENIGWLGLNDLKRGQVDEIREIFRGTLRLLADQTFPIAMAGREDALRHVDELIRMASEAS